MNDVLIRRLLGALVLLAAAFAVASLLPEPASVSMPRGGAEQVVRYDLQTGQPLGLKLEPRLQEAPAAAEAERAPEEVPDDPEPEAEDRANREPQAAPTATPEPVQPRPAVPEPVAPRPPAPSPPAAAGWAVQIGSFSEAGNARKVRERLVAARLPGKVQEVRVGPVLWYRVLVGPYAREADAGRALEQIKRLGYRDARVFTQTESQ